MADDEQSPQDEKNGDGADGGGILSDTSTLIVAAIVAVGALGGGFAGKQYLAPMFAGGSSSADAAQQEASHGDGGGSEGGGHGQGSSSAGHHEIGNLVVNPAEAGGGRFLMVTLSLEVEPQSVTETLTERDAEIRDLLNRILGSKTVSELSDIDRRDEIKAEIRKSINQMLEHGKVKKVYTPQYVLQ